MVGRPAASQHHGELRGKLSSGRKYGSRVFHMINTNGSFSKHTLKSIYIYIYGCHGRDANFPELQMYKLLKKKILMKMSEMCSVMYWKGDVYQRRKKWKELLWFLPFHSFQCNLFDNYRGPIMDDFKEALGSPTKSYFIWAAHAVCKCPPRLTRMRAHARTHACLKQPTSLFKSGR